ncbi:response regulator [Blastopirellula marina]|uniref:Transcriptional regulator n=1 Tax=Blastopirellula marina TaxID=124 RepID=A0A2S8GUA3_9BACT|nr:response regulator [Blastopirellula marina]PQO35208.1 transcriptional regulator [Blastopirellula marina]PQO47999.1 transcriptional regulator [Blastopirellula marina]PTL43957.1 transcriptional regulator [Blastopirellula marina]
MSTSAVRKLNVVIVDDDPSMKRLLMQVLSNRFEDRVNLWGFTDPHEAQQWMDQNCCDLLISDIEMPNIDGMGMLIFAKRRNSWTQVIFLTGHSSWDRVTEAIENGASDFLLKPLDKDELVKLVDQELERFVRWQTALRGNRKVAAAN